MLFFKAKHSFQIFTFLSDLWSSSHYLLKTNLTLCCCYYVQQYISDTTEKLTIAFKLQGRFLYHLLFSGPPEAFPCPLFWHLCAPECNSQPSSQWTRKPAIPPASSLLSGRQTLEEWALLLKANGSCTLPGLKMDWNFVYLKHTRPPHREKDPNRLIF